MRSAATIGAHVVWMVVFSAMGCASSDGGGATVREDGPKSVTVSCLPGIVPLGGPTTCKAKATMPDGKFVDVTASATWSTADAKLAAISDDAATKGTGNGILLGKTKILAVYLDVTGSVDFEISDTALTSVTIDPKATFAGIGRTTKFTAQANYADGTFVDVTDAASWASSDLTLATVNNKGVASCMDTGSVTISALYFRKRGTATLSIPAREPVALEITPSTISPHGRHPNDDRNHPEQRWKYNVGHKQCQLVVAGPNGCLDHPMG